MFARCASNRSVVLGGIIATVTAVWFAVPGSHPWYILTVVVLFIAALSLLLRRLVPRHMSTTGACLTCDQSCPHRIAATHVSKPVALPVPVVRELASGQAWIPRKDMPGWKP